MTTHKVETATAAEEAAVFAILTLAFGSDPATRWTWPDPKAYLGAFPHFAKAFGGAAFAHGSAHRIGSAGAALWLPPGVGSDEAAMDALMQRTADAQTAADGPQVMQQMARYHPHEPHWYLPLIGIDPAHQGKGLGGVLMKHATDICDRDGVPAYLESVQPQERPVVRTPWLRGAGHHPGRQFARDHAHAAQAAEAIMPIRPATVADADAIAALHAASWRSAYRGILKDDTLGPALDGERRTHWRRKLAAMAPADAVLIVDGQGSRA